MLAISKLRFYSEQMREVMNDSHPWGELGFPLEKAKRWAPLNRGVWMAARVLLAGHLLQAKGDRVAMHSSVEVRYPFLDEAVFDFTAKLHPRWKLRGFPRQISAPAAGGTLDPKVDCPSRHKVIFRAPLDSFHMDPEPPFVAQLLSEDSLRRTGYFDLKEVAHWRETFAHLAGRFAPATLGGNGADRGRRHPALAPPIHGRRLGGSAGVGRLRTVPRSPASARADAGGERCRLRQFFEQAPGRSSFIAGIVLLLVRHRQPFLEVFPRLLFASHLHVNVGPARCNG